MWCIIFQQLQFFAHISSEHHFSYDKQDEPAQKYDATRVFPASDGPEIKRVPPPSSPSSILSMSGMPQKNKLPFSIFSFNKISPLCSIASHTIQTKENVGDNDLVSI